MSNELQTANTSTLQSAEDYSKTKAIVDTVKKAVFPGAADAELMLFFHKCQTVGVHPLAGMIHPLKFRQQDGTFKVSFIVSIDLLRSRSDKPEYDGVDEPEYEGKMVITYDGQDIEVPEQAKVKVYRKDRSRPFVGIARWTEFYPGDKKGHQWRQKPYLMLAKCAEAQARRQAFPQELDKLYTAEELEKTTSIMANIEPPKSTKPAVKPEDITGEFPEKPTEEQRTSGKLISEKQAGLLFGSCKKSNVDPKNVAYYCQKPNLYWLTWDNKDKKNFNAILKTVQEQPKFFDKYKPVEKPAEPATPSVMGAEEFRKEVESHFGFGYTEADFIEDLSIMGIEGGIDAVPAEKQPEVLAMLAKQEQAGA